MPAESPLRDRQHADFQLIETLRWEPDCGFLRLGPHLRRLRRSAGALGFTLPHDPQAELEVAVGGTVSLRVRLTLASDGRIGVATQPLVLPAEQSVWRLKIATIRIDSADPLIAHKTTRRNIYEKARAEFRRDECEEVLLLNEKGELCEGTFTNVFVDGRASPLLTPVTRSGLLPGVLRAELLETGQAVENVLTMADLHSARALFVGNSLRGLIPAELA